MCKPSVPILPIPQNNPLDGTEFNNKFIFRSNEFLNANQGIIDGENPLSTKYREMTINEQRLFMLTLLKMTPNLVSDSNNNKPFEINIIPTSTMLQIFKGNKKYYETLREAASALYNLSVDLSEEMPGIKSKTAGVKNFHKKRIFDEMKFGPDYGGLYFRFAEAVRPYLYDLYGKQYTKIAGRLVFSLSSTYGIRLLELLLQYQNIKEFQQAGEIRRVFELDEFKRIFGLDKNKSYKQIGNIKNRVINYAMKDINNNTKYRIEYEDIKEGRSIKKFAFKMKLPAHDSKIMDEPPTVELVLKESVEKEHINIHDEGSSLVEKLMSYGIGPRVSRKLVSEYKADTIKANVEYSFKQPKIKNLAGYIRKAIENDYAWSNGQKPKESAYSKLEIFKDKLIQLGIGNVCSNVIVKTLEENRNFSTQEESWLNEFGIDEVSLREAYISSAPENIQVRTLHAKSTQKITSKNANVRDDTYDEAILLRGELGMAIACRDKISKDKYRRAQELEIVPALQSMAKLCEIKLMDLIE